VVAWLKDRRGAQLIEFVLILPLLVFLLFAGWEVYKVISVKISLNTGVYRATRSLSPVNPADPVVWEAAKWRARDIVEAALRDNELVGDAASQVLVVVRPPATELCGSLFDVSAQFPMRTITFLSVFSEMGSPQILMLGATHTGYVEFGCNPVMPTPTPVP